MQPSVHSSYRKETSENRILAKKIKSHVRNDNSSRPCMPYRKRLKRYCHVSLLEGTTKELQEGKLVQKKKQTNRLELVYVHIVLRHGDRTPATKNPKLGYPEMHYKCGLSASDLSSNWALAPDMWNGLNDFPPLSPVGNIRNAKLKLHPGTGNQSCGTGDLTSQGFLQHLNLGTLMQRAYGQLFPGIDLRSEIYVQSSDFRRTIRSAGAFLLGFIPDVRNLREMVEIHVQPGSLNQSPPVTVPLTYRRCKGVLRLRERENRQKGYYEREKVLHWMQDKLIDMFKLKMYAKAPWTDLFDKVMTRGCHSLHSRSLLPCTKDKQCIDCDLGKKMFDFADWSISEKYPSNTSVVAIAPFLKHSLHDTMERTVSKEHSAGRYKIMLTFTHDSMLNQLMKTLGLPVTEWIPYASRLSFELWKASSDQSEVKYFVRVLFNGRTATLIDFVKWRDSMVPLNVWTYNKLCGI